MAKIGTNANCIMLANFGTNSGGFTWWSNFELIIQVEPHTIGQIWNQCKWNSSYLAGEITQVIDSIPWVRCASGNVFIIYVTSQNLYILLVTCNQYVLIIFHQGSKPLDRGKPPSLLRRPCFYLTTFVKALPVIFISRWLSTFQ